MFYIFSLVIYSQLSHNTELKSYLCSFPSSLPKQFSPDTIRWGKSIWEKKSCVGLSRVRKASILGQWLIIESQCLRIVRRASQVGDNQVRGIGVLFGWRERPLGDIVWQIRVRFQSLSRVRSMSMQRADSSLKRAPIWLSIDIQI